jgi:hypothetical protein
LADRGAPSEKSRPPGKLLFHPRVEGEKEKKPKEKAA